MSQNNLPDLAGLVQLIEDALRQGRQEPNRLQTCVQECRQLGVELLPLDINRSGRVCGVEDGRNIRIGLSLLASEHDAFLDDVLSERAEKGAFQSFQDFCERIDRIKMPDDFLPRAIQVGAFDALEASRACLFQGYPTVLQSLQKAAQERAAGQFDLFAALTPSVAKTAGLITLPPAKEWTEAELIAQEHAAVGFSLLEFMAATDAAEALQESSDEELIPEPSEEQTPDALPDVDGLTMEPAKCEESNETPGLKTEEDLPPIKTEEPHAIALILHLPADTPASALLQLRDVLKQHPGPSRVILEWLDRYAQKIWVRMHTDYAVQMTPELIQAIEGLMGAQTTRLESVRSRLVA